jgi:GT2 family glycosyltransferase
MYAELIRERFALLPGAFVVSRSALAIAGNFDSLSEPCEDYDFSLRVALESAVVCIEKPVVQHRLHGGNTPETNIYLGAIKVARKHLKLLETSHSLSAQHRRQSKAAWMLKIADSYYALDQSPLALKYYMQALRFRPSCADVQLARQMAASLVPVAIRQKLKSLRDTSSK